MIHGPFGIDALLLGCVLVVGAGEADRIPEAVTVTESPLVIVLDYREDGRGEQPNGEPSLAIREDGTVVLGSVSYKRDGLKPLRTKITRGEVQELLEFILVEQELARYDAEAVQKAVAAAANQERDDDHDEDAAARGRTALIVQSGDRRIETVHRSRHLDDYRVFSQVEAILRVCAVRERLERLRSELYAGGKPGIDKYLNLVNANFRRRNAKFGQGGFFEPFGEENLRAAWQMADGERFIVFSGGPPGFIITPKVVHPAGGEPKVTVDATILGP